MRDFDDRILSDYVPSFREEEAPPATRRSMRSRLAASGRMAAAENPDGSAGRRADSPPERTQWRELPRNMFSFA